jgi:hypothetical protein
MVIDTVQFDRYISTSRKNLLFVYSTLKAEAALCSETFVSTYQITYSHTGEDNNFNNLRIANHTFCLRFSLTKGLIKLSRCPGAMTLRVFVLLKLHTLLISELDVVEW